MIKFKISLLLITVLVEVECDVLPKSGVQTVSSKAENDEIEEFISFSHEASGIRVMDIK